MAVTITRSPWIDDDGTGTTGTVINNAEKTLLYNQIDAALAQLLPLTGGGSITGNVGITGNFTVAGVVTVNALGPHVFSGSGGVASFGLRALSAGNNIYAQLTVGNDTNAQLLNLYAFASNYATTGDTPANGALIRSTGAGGLCFSATDPGAPIRMFTNFAERIRILNDGSILCGGIATLNPANGVVVSAADGSVRQLFIAYNNSLTNVAYFFYCMNSSGAGIGGISQSGATGVVFNTSSDRRLKTDRGRATDLSALRAVEIHDFDWIADGRRDRGVFAQDTIGAFPRAISEGGDDVNEHGHLVRPWQTDYSKFVPDLIVGFHEHDAAIAALREQLATLKGSN